MGEDQPSRPCPGHAGLALGLALAGGMIVSTWIGTRALLRIKDPDTLQVTGSAKRRIVSDFVEWSATVSAQAVDMGSAYKTLSHHVPKVIAHLEKRGVPKKEIEVSSISIQTFHPRNSYGTEELETITGYLLTQNLTIRSRDVAKVSKIGREATELLNEGISLSSAAPAYYYTKLGDLKIKMLAEAARDARARAEQLANAVGAKVGALRGSRMGVIQINPVNSTETSSEGNNDTSSLEKDIITVVASTFAID